MSKTEQTKQTTYLPFRVAVLKSKFSDVIAYHEAIRQIRSVLQNAGFSLNYTAREETIGGNTYWSMCFCTDELHPFSLATTLLEPFASIIYLKYSGSFVNSS